VQNPVPNNSTNWTTGLLAPCHFFECPSCPSAASVDFVVDRRHSSRSMTFSSLVGPVCRPRNASPAPPTGRLAASGPRAGRPGNSAGILERPIQQNSWSAF